MAASIDFLDSAEPFAGWFVRLERPSVWVRYADVDFTEVSPASVRMRVRSRDGGKVSICIAEDPAFVEVTVPRCMDWTEIRTPLGKAVTGLQTLTATLEDGGVIDIDWIIFE